ALHADIQFRPMGSILLPGYDQPHIHKAALRPVIKIHRSYLYREFL
ncbi:hypothetical protein C5S35_18270, partial [Candidatus Methanophagaceae archaeon]